MTISLTKFNCFAGDIGLAKHNLNSDTLKIYLTNALPVASNTVYNTPADLSTAGGYTAGGAAISSTAYSQSGGTGTLTGSDVTFTSTSGFGPFRYVVLYNFTAGSKNLIGWLDYGSSISVNALGTFVVHFGSGILTVV